MKVLLTGVTGYVGKRLLPVLLEQGHEVICCVRDKKWLGLDKKVLQKVSLIEIDFLHYKTHHQLPENIDVAFYLIHSMKSTTEDFSVMESRAATNFKLMATQIGIKQVVYLSGIVNQDTLSKHLESRKNVESILSAGDFHLTTLRAGIIVGSGSASFEIIRDLVEKLPVMITPKWVLTRSQPIAIRNVIAFLTGVMLRPDCFDQSYDIGGPEILSYQQMLMQYAEVRKLKRLMITVPVMTPKLSSYWLYFVTSVSYPLAINLVDSMKTEVICRPNDLADRLGIRLLTYQEAIEKAFIRIEQNLILSSWKDSMASGRLEESLESFIQVPKFGCFRDVKHRKISNRDKSLKRIWSIGGDNGWYYVNWLWRIRGLLDLMVGGVGLRRGRTHPEEIHAGDSLDFWRVVYASKEDQRLLLFAEMKVPGEAWLEFRISEDNVLHQVATFRPRGILGRMYWYSVLPFHYFVFNGMINALAR